MLNLITDVPGLRVGNAADARLASGVTAIVFEEPAVASVEIRGGAPGGRDTSLLQTDMTVAPLSALMPPAGFSPR